MDPQNHSNSPEKIIIHKNNSTPLVAAILFLALVIGAGVIYLGGQKNNLTQINPLSPTPSIVTKNVSPTPITQNNIDALPSWEIHESKKLKDLAFPGYSISYPPEWSQKEERNDITSTVTLTKDGNEIKIYQAPTGGNLCVFEGNLPEGPVNDYRNKEYVDTKIGDITLRRIQTDPNQGKIIYSFCSNSEVAQESYGSPTFIGNITFSVLKNDPAVLSEMDKILSTIKIL